MWVTVLAAVCESETGRIVETTGRAVNYFRHQGERLQDAWAELFKEQQLGEVLQALVIRNGEHCTKSFQIDVFFAYVVMCRKSQVSSGDDRLFRTLVCDLEECVLGAIGLRVDEVHDLALVLAEDCRMRIGDEITNRGGVPVISTCEAVSIVQALLYYGPFACGRDYKTVQVDLKAVGDCVVVDACSETACTHQSVAVETALVRECSKLVGCVARKAAAPAADVKTEFVCAWCETALKCTHHGGRDSGGVPVHSHHCAERLKPEWIAKT